MSEQKESHFIRHIPCDACGSRDNNSLYSDGHQHCFGCGAYVAGSEDSEGSRSDVRKYPSHLIQSPEISPLVARKITEATCAHFGYGKAEHDGKTVQVAPYYDKDGQLVAQKIRGAGKTFKVLGEFSEALPFGSHCWQKSGKMIVVTEGEIDALSMSQVQGNKWPVVSIGCGAGGQIKKYIAKHRDYFLGFEKVVLMFDNDEPGRKAAEEAAAIIGPKAHVASLLEGYKDPNDMLVAGKAAELIDAMWKAKAYRPDGLVGLDTLKDKAREKPRMGLSFPWPRLTELLSGIQKPYIYAIGAATGAGKTDVLRELIVHLTVHHKVPVGIFSLEEEPHVTAVGLASKVAKKKLHTPDGWDEDAFEQSWSQLVAGGKIHLYDSFGLNEWDAISDKIEYLRHAEGVEYFVLDHLTALAAAAEDERKELEQIMAEMSSLVTRLGITIFMVSHLATPEGKPHEEGGRVMIRHMKGSRAIGFWSFGCIGLERNQQAEDPEERHTTTIRILKARGFGWNVGKCSHLKFNEENGMLDECDGPPTTGGAFGFTPTEKQGGGNGGSGSTAPDF